MVGHLPHRLANRSNSSPLSNSTLRKEDKATLNGLKLVQTTFVSARLRILPPLIDTGPQAAFGETDSVCWLVGPREDMPGSQSRKIGRWPLALLCVIPGICRLMGSVEHAGRRVQSPMDHGRSLRSQHQEKNLPYARILPVMASQQLR